MNISGDAIPALAQVLEDKSCQVCYCAAEGLVKLVQASMNLERDMHFLLEALKCTDSVVRKDVA